MTNTDAFDCTDGEMRLVSASGEITGATDGEVRNGRLEICYQGVWGAVYDPDWSAIDAAVTCQQLGFDPRGMHKKRTSLEYTLYVLTESDLPVGRTHAGIAGLPTRAGQKS